MHTVISSVIRESIFYTGGLNTADSCEWECWMFLQVLCDLLFVSSVD